MKRSEINAIIRNGINYFTEMNFVLPPFAYFSLSDWKKNRSRASEIFDLRLGWDVTDFGDGDFDKCGLLLFTLRNGHPSNRRYPKPYAEKIMIAGPRQVTPLHFHAFKMEDIIVRGGAKLGIELHHSNARERLSRKSVMAVIDGIPRTFKAGERVVLNPGESICLTQRLYHTFYGVGGRVLIGEVSRVNDDATDNRFLQPVGRFPEITEDVKPEFLLCGDYPEFID